jgi:photosystem II stability/assembly factor-like uncharacterized protein
MPAGIRSVERLAIGVACVLAVATAPAVAAPVRSAHSGWTWGSPRPQGQDLAAIAFAGQTGYAAGAFGTLLKTADGGRSWSALATGLSEPLATVRALTADSVVVGGVCALRRSDDGGRTFRRLPWTASDESCFGGIQAVDFPTSATGVLLLGNGTVLRSTDSGRTWSRRTSVPGTPAATTDSPVPPTDMDFTSETIGVATTAGGGIYRTTDGGSTWTAVVAEPWSITSVTFPTGDVGYASGTASAVLRTVDAGRTWSEQGLPADVGGLARIACASPDVCAGVTAAGDRLARTTNGGRAWDSVAPSSFALHAVGLPSATQVTAVGASGDTVVSADAGASFTDIDAGLEGAFTGVRAVSAGFGVAFGRFGALARTTDGGETWVEQDAATANDITDASFVDANRGFVLDRSGQVLRTDNAGESYEILNTGTTQRPEAVRALSAARVLLIGPAGVRRSVDGGRTFTANTQKVVRDAPLFDGDRAGTTVVAFGPRALLASTDGGARFRTVRLPSRATRIDDFDLVDGRTAFLLDAQGTLFRTDDVGRHWRPLPGLGSEVAYAVHFADRRHGWAAVTEFGAASAGWVMRTDDGGRTWTPQLVADARLARDGLTMSGPNAGLALASDGSLFATRVAGRLGAASKLGISSPTRRVRRAGDAVKINGRLSPARGGEHVVVSVLERGGTHWRFEDAVVASDGRFTVVVRIRRGASIVAQWAGNDRSAGAGTRALGIGAPR